MVSAVLVVVFILCGFALFDLRLRGFTIGVEPVEARLLPAPLRLEAARPPLPLLQPDSGAIGGELVTELARTSAFDGGAERLSASSWSDREAGGVDRVPLPDEAVVEDAGRQPPFQIATLAAATAHMLPESDETGPGSTGARDVVMTAALQDDVVPAFVMRSRVLRSGRPARELAVCHAGDNRSIDLDADVSGGISAPDRVLWAGADGLAFGQRLAAAARRQMDELIIYNEQYFPIGFPGGDVPAFYGVCTDVIVRAYRALGVDLQVLVAEAGVGARDRSIDHRRTSVLRKFFKSAGGAVPVSDYGDDYLPGDIVTYDRPQNSGSRFHIAIVSADIGPSGDPMIIHNRGWGVQQEDALFIDRITGHYRYGGPGQPQVAGTVIPPPQRGLRLGSPRGRAGQNTIAAIGHGRLAR